MESTERELSKIYGLLMNLGFAILILDIVIFGKLFEFNNIILSRLVTSLMNVPVFNTPFNIKLTTFVALGLAALGSTARKKINMNILSMIFLPVIVAIIGLTFCIVIQPTITNVFSETKTLSPSQFLYIAITAISALCFYYGISSINRFIRVQIGKDIWNIEGESFEQQQKLINTDTSVNIPMTYYYHNNTHRGWINVNPFRGTLLIGVQGSGKSFSVVVPYIQQMIEKDYSMCIYDYKYPDLTEFAYLTHLKTKSNNQFNILHVGDVRTSVRVNPLSPKYLHTLIDAEEISSCMVNAMQKSDAQGGSEKFFVESAINLLSCCIYFLMKYKNGKYCDIPHLISLVNADYHVLFTIIRSNRETRELCQGIYSAFKNKAFDQLEGQVGTLRIFISKLGTKEAYYIFGADEYDLKLSDKDNPKTLILASNEDIRVTASILYATTVSRITKLVNSQNNKPFGLIVDEAPTLYVHDVDNLLATARSKKVAVLLGMQELPQLKKQYGRLTAETVNTLFANVICGKVSGSDTIGWLEKNLGKKKRVTTSVSINKKDTSYSISERLENTITEGRMTQLATGELIGWVAQDAEEKKQLKGIRKFLQPKKTKYVTPIFHCKANIDLKRVETEKKHFREVPTLRDFDESKLSLDEFLIRNMERVRDNIELIYEEFK